MSAPTNWGSMSSNIPFTGNPLDRASDQRTDNAWLAQTRLDVRARFVLMWKGQPIIAGAEGTKSAKLFCVSGKTASNLGADDAQEIFLGLDPDGIPYFARDISAVPEPVG